MAEIHQKMSELLDKQMNAQTKKNFRGSCKLLQAHEKVCNEMKGKKCARKNLDNTQKNSENDLHKLLGNNCGYNEGTICVVKG